MIEVEKVGPSGLFTNYIYKAIPLAFDESMSYYETVCGLLDYLKNTIIPAVNNNADAVIEVQNLMTELQNYVDNYFNNTFPEMLDAKLDELVENGTIASILENYANIERVFNTCEEMKSDTTLVAGQKIRTLGYYEINDGGASEYIIKDEEPTSYYESIGDTLYAELITHPEMNVTQFGVDYNQEDVSTILNNVIHFCSTNNITLIIPEHTYNLKSLITKNTEYYNYHYFLDILSNTKIKGINKNTSVLKIDDTILSYTSVFFNDSNISNVELNNFSIEQYYQSGSNMVNVDRSNLKCDIVMYGEVNNIKIKNMLFKNCCGVNTVSFNNTLSHNIIIDNNEFDYYHVIGINHYDRSILYCECHDYLITNNKIKGNFETLGGIECHGYNGRCENNIVEKCYTSIHIAPHFDETIKTANIIVTNNILTDNAISIKIWENTNLQSTIGCNGIIITNNNIKMNGYVFNQNFWLSVGNHRAESLTGITINEYTKNHNFSDIIISNNILKVEDYTNYTQYVTVGTALCSGISISGSNNVKNVQITNNHIEGWAGAGISTGSLNSSIVKTTENVIITNNNIINVGTGVENQIVYKSPISLRYGIINNMIIRNNNIIKTDSSYNAYVSIYNQTNAESIRTNLYCDNNIIYSVLANQYSITSNNLKNIIINNGVTADRPINANKGDTYYDTQINKLIVYNGTSWINTDGTSL